MRWKIYLLNTFHQMDVVGTELRMTLAWFENSGPEISHKICFSRGSHIRLYIDFNNM